MILKLIKAWIFDYRLKRAIKKADYSARVYKRKYIVLVNRGKPVVVSMQGVKRLIRQGKFRKGFNADTAREIAVYETARSHYADGHGGVS